MVKNTSDFKELIHESKVQYDVCVSLTTCYCHVTDYHARLLEDKEDLENAMATEKTFNPFKVLSTYRAARLLSEAAKALWIETMVNSCPWSLLHI